MKNTTIPTIVLGASGYVGGELLRLIAGHPRLKLAAASSRGGNTTTIGEEFPHLATAYPSRSFASPEEALEVAKAGESLALFSAAPHGASAAMIEAYLVLAEQRDIDLHVVDASADYRFATATAFEAVYGVAHGAPDRLSEFAAAVPEHLAKTDARHIGNPGCFASAMLLASVPLLKSARVASDLFACGVTGSTGSGKEPAATTHHPFRHSNLFAYKPLAHRHVAEVEELAARASQRNGRFRFVPHSGPFARGIHMTVQARLERTASTEDILQIFRDYHAAHPFVRVVDTPPRIKDVAGSNYAHISAASDGESVAVFCVIDNLLKGAAGSAVQWMNRLFGLPETTGLDAPAPGWI